jgi:hypothetical protein
MTLRKSIQVLLLLAILAIGCYVTLRVVSTPGEGETPPSTDAPADNLFDIKGFSVSNFSGADLVYKIRADEFKIAPRKFSIFKIRIYNQGSMKNVHIQSYLTPDRNQLEIFPLQQLGTVNRCFCEGFQLDIYRSGKHIFNVTADQAKADLIQKRTTLLKTVITYIPSAEIIAGRSVVWDARSQNFIIFGPFLKDTKAGRILGRGIRIDLLNHQMPIKPKLYE